MTDTDFEKTLPKYGEMPLWWFATAIILLSVIYLCAAVMTAPEFSAIGRGIFFPLKLFLVASAPMIGGVGFLWADKAIADRRRRRFTRLLVVLLWAFGVVALVSSLT
jgi:uncharacterized membrane-anchored protein